MACQLRRAQHQRSPHACVLLQANPTLLHHKWENAFTIDANSWGFDRSANHDGYLNITTILYVSHTRSACQPRCSQPRAAEHSGHVIPDTVTVGVGGCFDGGVRRQHPNQHWSDPRWTDPKRVSRPSPQHGRLAHHQRRGNVGAGAHSLLYHSRAS